MTRTIGLICGSLREKPYNRIIAQSLIDMVDSHHLKSAIQDVDGIIIVSPEYNSGMPDALKNALDWASRPRGSAVLTKKPVGLGRQSAERERISEIKFSKI
ncbi:NAD(P)H-dependent oxidoreductase [Peribacillus frigoritolerans]|nr:NAD(P)H-dependent oxidoreductase [Peribacillus frigoritolerans]ULM96290.1 NAD(P)H-dependent oxidoreductase [Peribacillus frigoritolerans]